MTTLTQVATMGQQELSVEAGVDWSKGKQVLLCTAAHCVWNRLAADGRQQALPVVTPIAEQLPVRSAVFLLNRVRYYVKRQADDSIRVMREVDGGASTLLADVESFQLQYLGNDGRETNDRREVVRVRVTIEMDQKSSRLMRDIAIRT